MINAKLAREVAHAPALLKKIDKMIRDAAREGEPGGYVSEYDATAPVIDELRSSGYETSMMVVNEHNNAKKLGIYWGYDET